MSIKHKPISRLLAGFLLPHLIGALLVFPGWLMMLNRWDGLSLIPAAYFTLVIASIMFIGLQAIIYTVLMETLINKPHRKYLTVVSFSCLLGMISSLPLGIVLWHYIIIGAITGIISGIILRKMLMSSLDTMK